MVEPEIKPGAEGTQQPPAEEQLPWLEELTPRQIVAELDRYIIGQQRPSGPWPSPCATGGGAAGARRDARRDRAEEHHHDRADRRGEDRDRPAAGPAGRSAVHQGRGVEVHRGRLRRPRRGVDDPRPAGAGGQHGARRAEDEVRRGRRSWRRSGCWTSCCRRARSPPAAGAGATAAGERPCSWSRRRARSPSTRRRGSGRGAHEDAGETACAAPRRGAGRADVEVEVTQAGCP